MVQSTKALNDFHLSVAKANAKREGRKLGRVDPIKPISTSNPPDLTPAEQVCISFAELCHFTVYGPAAINPDVVCDFCGKTYKRLYSYPTQLAIARHQKTCYRTSP